MLSFAAHCFLWWQFGEHSIKPVSALLLGEAVRTRKIGGFTVPVGSRYSNCNLQNADYTPLKSGVGILDINQKVEPRTEYRYQINLRSGATGKKIFTSTGIERTF
jgi:hypothetical protein